MKVLLILAASVVLNIGLGVAYCRKSTPPGASTELAQPEGKKPNPATRVIEKVVTNMVTVTKPAAPFDWRTVESDDYKQYIANLRAIGCPEKTLRDIITADVNDLYRQRVRSSNTNRFEYWKPGLLGNAFDEKRVAQQQEQVKERRDLLATLLGESYSDQPDPAGAQLFRPMEQMTGDFLSPAAILILGRIHNANHQQFSLTLGRSAGREAPCLAGTSWAARFFHYSLASDCRFRYWLGQWTDHWSFRGGGCARRMSC